MASEARQGKPLMTTQQGPLMVFFSIVVVSMSILSACNPTITGGNLLFSSEDTLHEYTVEGIHVQSFPVPYPVDPPRSTEYARDIVVGHRGIIHVFNGTFDPYLSSLNTVTTHWTHRTHLGWSTVNSVSYGGIAAKGQLVFVTDMSTYDDDENDEVHGILRFNTFTGGSTRFADELETIDLNLGLDGLLYALSPGGSPGGRDIHVFDPDTLTELAHIDLRDIFGWTEHRSVAVTAGGEIVIADWDGDLQKIDSSGNILLEANLCDIAQSCYLLDVDISGDGLVVVGDWFGGVVVTDVDFSSFSSFTVGDRGVFVNVIPAL
jgi:hypothetical protein